jgi:SAM-dependent methyltransferase
MDPFDATTLRFYADIAPDYAASGPSGASRYLDGFLSHLRAGARILELGCGSGKDAAHMIERGFHVDPTDGCASMAAQASARLGFAVPVMRFEELTAVAVYDAVYASASLLHVPIAALGGVLERIHAALKPGGRHFASFKAGGTPGRDRFGRYFNYLSPVQAEAVYAATAPWAEVVVLETTGGGYDGVQGPWLTVLATKRA